MHVHRLTRVLPYDPDDLFQMVGDVAHYPEFVPWVSSMRTWNARTEADGVTVVDAEASVGFAFLKERFSTRVRRDPVSRTVSVTLISGPFRRLVNEWRFESHPEGTEIHFMIDFAFKSRFLDAMLEANFDRAVSRLIGCFEKRAETLYAKVQPATAQA
jgi:coenzyme Q-binding protein COQ10